MSENTTENTTENTADLHVRLKNGSKEFDPVVSAALITLHGMAGDLEGLLALYDLHAKCKDPAYEFFSPPLKARLVAEGLVEADGRIHDTIRNIVLCSVTFEGGQAVLTDPRVSA